MPARSSGGFVAGLATALMLFLLLLGIYALRAPLSAALPEIAPALDAYAAAVDALRAALRDLWAMAAGLLGV
jgi:hypothetical protein